MRTKTMSKKNLTDQANDLVEQVTPHVEAARERIMTDYLPAAQTMLAEARDTALEVAKDARAAAGEAAANAEKSTRKSRKKAAKQARSKAGKMATAAAAAAPLTAPLAERIAEKVDPKPKRRKRFFLLVALAGVATFVARKARAGSESGTSYAPPRPAPTPRPTVATEPTGTRTPPPAPADTHFEPEAGTTDSGGAFLDEMAADAAEEPHPVTTPDNPAEVEDLSDAKHARKG